MERLAALAAALLCLRLDERHRETPEANGAHGADAPAGTVVFLCNDSAIVRYQFDGALRQANAATVGAPRGVAADDRDRKHHLGRPASVGRGP